MNPDAKYLPDALVPRPDSLLTRSGAPGRAGTDRVPDDGYAGRTSYTSEVARRYQVRPRRKHEAEMALVRRAVRDLPPDLSVLDVPCGGARVALELHRLGFRDLTAADLSLPMIAIARERAGEEGVDITVERADIEALHYREGAFDAAVCFRLFHHFPTPAVRARAVGELCRVARRYVLLSYFSPWSWTSFTRKIRRVVRGEPYKKHATPLPEVEGYFGHAGFRLVRDRARLPLVHTLHLALFERVDGGPAPAPPTGGMERV